MAHLEQRWDAVQPDNLHVLALSQCALHCGRVLSIKWQIDLNYGGDTWDIVAWGSYDTWGQDRTTSRVTDHSNHILELNKPVVWNTWLIFWCVLPWVYWSLMVLRAVSTFVAAFWEDNVQF